MVVMQIKSHYGSCANILNCSSCTAFMGQIKVMAQIKRKPDSNNSWFKPVHYLWFILAFFKITLHAMFLYSLRFEI